MKFSERWLRTMVDPPLDTAGLCERLTMAGLEVESSEPAAPPFSGVVVGEIDEVEPHPNADRLRVCMVDVGAAERLSHRLRRAQCRRRHEGAVRDRRRASFPAGCASPRPRCAASNRRACCARRASSASTTMPPGLLELPADARVGADVRDVLALDDTLITLKLTPNRADCLSVLGIARDVAALTGARARRRRPPRRRR